MSRRLGVGLVAATLAAGALSYIVYLQRGASPAGPRSVDPFVGRRPALDNLYRLRGVHYFQRGWPYTFWDTVRLSRLDEDFRLIRSHGFNTIVLMMSWGKFQTRIDPPTYDDAMFAKLERVMTKAREHGLWVTIRVGTPEHVPVDLPNSTSYNIPDLMFEPRQLDALASLLLEASRRLQPHANLYGLFHSWEDFSQYLQILPLDEPARLAFENRSQRFRRYLRDRGSLAEWNGRWQTSYQSFDEIPIPTYRSSELRAYIDFIGDYIVDENLSRMKTASGVALGYEARLDREPVIIDGRPGWHGYERTFRLPSQYSFLAGYYNPYWGASNDGGFIAPEEAARNFSVLLDTIQTHADLPIFFDQLNLADDTPAFTRTNTKLRYPHDEARAAELILPLLFQRSLGYSLWTYQDYVGNVVADGSFLSVAGAWKTSGALAYDLDAAGDQRLRLAPGQRLEQQVSTRFNPGRGTGVPYRFDLEAAAPAGPAQTLRVRVVSDRGREAVQEILIEGDQLRRYQVILNELGDEGPATVVVEASASNTSALQIDDVRVWNHEMATGLVDGNGLQRRSRAQTYQRLNLDWEAFETGAALPAREHARQTCSEPVTCSGVHADRWVGPRAMIPVYVPFAAGTVDFTYVLPEGAGHASPPQLHLRWLDSPPAGPDVTVMLQPGQHTVAIPVQRAPAAGGSPGRAGDRVLVARMTSSFRIGKDLRDLSYQFVSLGNDPPALPLGQSLGGRYRATIEVPDANRVVLRGRMTGGRACVLSTSTRGLPPLSIALGPGEGWQARAPVWRERLQGKPELFIDAPAACGLTIDASEPESERTPNTVYR